MKKRSEQWMCGGCGHIMRAASAPGDRPRPGDCATCPGCGEFFVREAGGRWRPMLMSEFLAQPPGVRAGLAAARSAVERVRAAAAAL